MLSDTMNSTINKENSPNCIGVIPCKTTSSPTRSSSTVLMYRRSHQPLEDHDSNSQDSGFFSVPSDDSNSLFGLIDSQSVGGKKNVSLNISRSKSFACPNIVLNNTDDAFIDSVSQSSLPAEFDNLIVGDVLSQKSPIIKPIFRQTNVRYSSGMAQKADALPFEDIKNKDGIIRKRKLFNELDCTSNISDTSKRLRHNVDLLMSFGSPKLDIAKTSSTAPVFDKKTTLFDYGFCKKSTSKFPRSFSTTEDTIKAAFDKENNELNLIGDFSQSFILPLLSFSRHADLRSISPETLAQLLDGIYDDYIESYLIIDCRYPYEYEGGHIRGAVNIYTKEHLLKSYTEDKLVKKSAKTENVNKKRNILIFHCEFSSERGPNLSRYLRNADRHKNSTCYPFLDHPEMYLLDGGYCKFFGQYSHLCEPSNYRSMYDPAHMKDLRIFRSKSKTWDGHNNEGVVPRVSGKNTLKRLGFN